MEALMFYRNSVLNANRPDQMPHSALSDLDLHCLPITMYPFGVFLTEIG